ncbi:transcriptional activator RinB [Staphylococcus lugdunensis]|uniref:transcriptional activator RinB n=1 Tax=Staphylococcus lugdunensis TaxID=28035 RepID=UPI001F57EBC6|nr:transcriptional activator RinB [Staphylococcus lugdunensis]MCI2764752.1 transcriptional activator RinB [Staphylococcus lugdunensis]MCI2801140.1 transcriptional activator RinB [Staphylococcus lugdunensis]
MIKRILKIWFTVAVYELGKWIGRELYYKLTANDEVDIAPDDYARISDQIDLNEAKEVFIK